MENKSITVKGKLLGGSVGDTILIVVQSEAGPNIDAHCNTQCGDWFVHHPTGSTSLKESLKGKNIILEYAAEPNGDRLPGVRPDTLFFFVKSVEIMPNDYPSP